MEDKRVLSTLRQAQLSQLMRSGLNRSQLRVRGFDWDTIVFYAKRWNIELPKPKADMHSPEKRLEGVKLSDAIGVKAAAEQFGVRPGTIAQWRYQFNKQKKAACASEVYLVKDQRFKTRDDAISYCVYLAGGIRKLTEETVEV